MPPMPDFAAHRASLLERLGDDEAVLVFAGPTHLRNGDADYRYRPDSDLYWLTGWEDPEAVAWLRPGEEPLTMFVQARDKEREQWDGRRPGPEGAKASFGADAAFTIAELEKELPRLLQGVRKLHYGFAVDADHDSLLMASIKKAARAARQNGLSWPETFISPSLLLHELRLHKTDDELAVLREAARIGSMAMKAAMARSEPGLNEYQIEALLTATYLEHGSNGPGYTPIVAGGAGATILHYITNRERLQDGELLLVDAGCEFALYTCDITHT